MSEKVKLSSNDRRVLAEIEATCGEYDGYVAHGAANWTAVRRLQKLGLVSYDEMGECQSCHEPHDAWIIVPVDGWKDRVEP